MDANQCWDVEEAVTYMMQLAKFKPVWIEEPTSPDDVLGKLASSNYTLLDSSLYSLYSWRETR